MQGARALWGGIAPKARRLVGWPAGGTPRGPARAPEGTHLPASV